MSDGIGGSVGDLTTRGGQFRDEEYKELMRREELAREQTRREASALVKRLAETYTQLTNLMEQNPELAEAMDAEDRARKEAIDHKLRQNLRQADDAPRCRWVRQDGTSCGSPQMRNHIYCYAHRQMMEARADALRLPALEDANAIQVGLMRIQKALIDDTISVKKAGLLLYSMQLAITNIGQTTFGQAKDEELVTSTVDEAEAVSENQGLSNTEGAKEDRPGAGLLRMNGHAGGLQTEEVSKIAPMRYDPVWKPNPGQTHAKLG